MSDERTDGGSAKQALLVMLPEIALLISLFTILGCVLCAALGLPARLGLPLPVRAAGVAVLLAGLLLLAWIFSYRKPVNVFVSTFLTWRKAITRTLTRDKSARTEPLKVAGPHRYVRHPMYLGIVVMVLGWGLALDYTFILLMAGLFTLWFNLVVIPFEEKELRAMFGDEYGAYAKSVPRFIPSFRRHRG